MQMLSSQSRRHTIGSTISEGVRQLVRASNLPGCRARRRAAWHGRGGVRERTEPAGYLPVKRRRGPRPPWRAVVWCVSVGVPVAGTSPVCRCMETRVATKSAPVMFNRETVYSAAVKAYGLHEVTVVHDRGGMICRGRFRCWRTWERLPCL